MAATPESVYTGVANYVRRMAVLRPSKADELKEQQTSHLMNLLRQCTNFSHTDATTIFDHLESADAPWTPAQATRIQDVIVTLVSDTSSAATPTDSQKQTYVHLHHYFPAYLWATAASNDSIYNISRHVCSFFLDVLGLRNADEPTR